MIALNHYKTQDPNLLSFDKGDYIDIVQPEGGKIGPVGWEYGKIGNKYGYFSVKYVTQPETFMVWSP